MERHKFWIFLGIALTMGACLQYLKTPSPQHARMAGFGRFNALLDEGRAVVGAPVQEPELGIAVASANVDDEDDDDSDEASPADATKPGVKAADKKVDPKKTAAKKKKKKKKKADEKKPDLAAQQAEALAKAQAEAEEARRKAAADAANQPSPGALAHNEPHANTSNPAAGTAAPESIPETAAQWEQYLETSPSYAKTSHFIQYRKTGLVSSATFYQVTASMLADKSTAATTSSETSGSSSSASTLGTLIQSYGVLALSSSPDSTAFTMLFQYTEGAGADASVKGQATTAIQTYGHLQYVHFLATVLSSSADVNTKAQAISLVQSAAATAFSTTTQSTESTTNSAANAQQTFEPFLAILTALTSGNSASSNGSLQSSASGLLATLHSDLGV